MWHVKISTVRLQLLLSAHFRKLALEKNEVMFIPPYNDTDIMAGQVLKNITTKTISYF